MKEFVNKITIQGVVGFVSTSAEKSRFSVVVHDVSGEDICHVWFDCRANEVVSLERGDWVRVEGKALPCGINSKRMAINVEKIEKL